MILVTSIFLMEFYSRICYNMYMKNWSTNTKELSKNTDKFTIWKLEQLINFGLGRKRLSLMELRKYWNIIDIDPFKRKFLSLFVN